MSPFLKWSRCTRNRNPKIVCSSPSRPVLSVLYCLRNSWFAGIPFINQVSFTAGFERPDVQFTLTFSPIWYLARPPVIFGSVSGKTVNNEKKERKNSEANENICHVTKCQCHSVRKFPFLYSHVEKFYYCLLDPSVQLFNLRILSALDIRNDK